MSEQEPLIPDWVQALLQKEAGFEHVTYPSMTWEEKQNFWIGDFHKMMRSSGETSGDEYEGFTGQHYQAWKRIEPKIDEILAKLKDRLQTFDEGKMWRRILADEHLGR